MERAPHGPERHLVEAEDRGSLARDLPERYGPWQTCYDRFARWRRDGTWDRQLAHAHTKSDAVGEVEWEVSVDSTVSRSHQHATVARRKPGREDARGGRAPEDEALGRGRGGLSTKVHLACDGRGRQLSVVVTPGQRHESTQLGTVLDAIRVARPGAGGRTNGPSTSSPTRATATRAAEGCSGGVAYRTRSPSGVTSVSGAPDAPEDRRASTRRPIGGTTWWSGVNRLKQWRGIATRYEKRAVNYRAMLVIAALVIWLIS
jgi:transposase